MNLPKELKEQIADNIIRVVAPTIFFGMILSAIGILVVGGHQYQRLIPTFTIIILIIPAYFFARQGQPLIGMWFVLACLCLAILVGMIVSGGIHAIAYYAALVAITLFVVLYGARGGLVFVVFTLSLGLVFSFLSYRGIIPSVKEPTTAYLFLIHGILLIMQFFFILIPVRLMFQAILNTQYQSRELQQAMAERKQAQNELQSILNKTPDIIYRLDTQGNITFVNEAVRKYGGAPESLIGQSIMTLIHQDDRERANILASERRTKNRSRDVEVRLSIPNPDLQNETEKSWSLFHVSSEGLYNENGDSTLSFIGIQGIARDISKIRQIEQQVNRLAAVVEQAAEDVLVTDIDGVIQYVNPRFEEVTGYSYDEVVGKTPKIFRSGKQDGAFYVNLWKTITAGDIWHGHIWNKIKNGSLILQDVTITPIFNSERQKTGYASVRRDITEQSKLQEQVVQAQKMEAMGTLAGGIAHDFNNILSAMIGFTELAVDELEDRPETREMLKMVLDSGKRATDLVRQILSFSRSQKSEAKPINPASVLREVHKLLRASLPATIDIKVDISSTNFILADATQIHQVLMNLCTNSAHAMKQSGGLLAITLSDVTLGQDDLSHRHDALPGDYIRISVEDNGAGMSKEVQQKAFDPFYTTKPLGEGTGMGLSTVHGIIKNLFGFITLYSEPNQGTSFHIFIPTIPKPNKTQERLAAKTMQRGTESILMVDDEPMQIKFVQTALERYGYQVTPFTDSTVAWLNFQQAPQAYDLIITDMTMPKMTGDILTQKILLKRPDIPVVMFTGFSEVMDKKKAEALGIRAFLYKPVVVADLLETIRTVLDQNSDAPE